MSDSARSDRWQHLVTCATAIEGAPAHASLEEARRQLDSVLSVFPRGLDPVEDFEGYAVRRLALAVLEAFDRRPPPGA